MSDDAMYITCPDCGSTNWRCWDEPNEVFINDDDPDGYEMLPVGYLVCRDCGKSWVDYDWPGSTWVGRNTREAFGWDDWS